MSPLDLIRYILWYATQNDIQLTTTRLVKFVYLADLYQARINKGITITSFPWKFIHYGPYCYEVNQIIEKAAQDGLICKKSFRRKDKNYNILSCHDNCVEKFEEELHISVLGQLKKAIKVFGCDTPKLLDYVYFETEPMENVRAGVLLDFSKARLPERPKKIQLITLSKEKINFAKGKIKKIGEKLRSDRKKIIQDEEKNKQYKDDSYYSFLEFLDGKDLDVGLTGTANIKIPE